MKPAHEGATDRERKEVKYLSYFSWKTAVEDSSQFNCPTFWPFSGPYTALFLEEYLSLLSFLIEWSLHRQASPTLALIFL
jgi:hypothetical protein